MTKINNLKLCLASSSKQRKLLLAQIGVFPSHFINTNINEEHLIREKPKDYVIRMAQTKSLETIESNNKFNDFIILTADTIVACGSRILNKSNDIDKALSTLKLLSGRRHKVYTSVVLYYQNKWLHRLVTSTVTFRKLMNSEIDDYLMLDEWKDKSGCYAIQGYAGKWVRFISGSYSNVVGMPLFEVSQLLNGIGYSGKNKLVP